MTAVTIQQVAEELANELRRGADHAEAIGEPLREITFGVSGAAMARELADMIDGALGLSRAVAQAVIEQGGIEE